MRQGCVSSAILAPCTVLAKWGRREGFRGERRWRDKSAATHGTLMAVRSEVYLSGLLSVCLACTAQNPFSTACCRVAAVRRSAR